MLIQTVISTLVSIMSVNNLYNPWTKDFLSNNDKKKTQTRQQQKERRTVGCLHL